MSPERRRYHREYARRKRAAKLAARNQSAARCQRRYGRFGICGAVLETRIVRGGGTETACPACERMARGICADCPQPVDGRTGSARRCAAHKAVAVAASIAKYRRNNRRALNRKARMYGRAQREDRNAYKRLWRAANPDLVRASKRREALRRGGKTPESVTRWRGEHPGYVPPSSRTCPTCPAPLTGRAKKCEACKALARATALHLLGKAA